MPQIALAILGGVALSLFAGISLSVLIRPSQYIRRSKNPWMEDTPWMRLQLRAVGLVFCLFILMVVSGILGGNTKSDLLEGFHKNLLIALWLAFVAGWVVGIVSWILWRFMAFRSFICTHFESRKLENPQLLVSRISVLTRHVIHCAVIYWCA
jgi:hypothetical protein